MSFSLGFRLLKNSQSTSSCSKAPARAYRLWPKGWTIIKAKKSKQCPNLGLPKLPFQRQCSKCLFLLVLSLLIIAQNTISCSQYFRTIQDRLWPKRWTIIRIKIGQRNALTPADTKFHRQTFQDTRHSDGEGKEVPRWWCCGDLCDKS